ncbi:MAG: hypothetical protein V7K49_20640 [Nostoc sp.]
MRCLLWATPSPDIVGWVELRVIQQNQGFLVLGFVPQPNLLLDL